MTLEENLKKLKNIQPDPTYTDYSRRAILASVQLQQITFGKIIGRILETAGSVALVGLMIFAITGGFSGSKYLSPVQFSGIDPSALHAEAQAIDMQINLANLTYTEATHIAAPQPVAPLLGTGTADSSTLTANVSSTVSATAISGTGVGSASLAASTTQEAPSSSISINEGLQKLTQ
ncbi:MAG: hypothetical protein KGJ13_02520 [Patescibacteria group bacterium]|nr:hypothetical protein [Patescibacteria group bacterium]